MAMDNLGKLLFPRLDRWQRRREIKMILLSVLAGLFLGGIIVLAMYLKNPPLSR